jgi:hypothetical protein
MSDTPNGVNIRASLVFMPEDEVLSANGICQVLRNQWFSVDLEKGLAFYQSDKRRAGQLRGASPQCNSSEHTARSLNQRLYPDFEVKLIPLVLLPIEVKDYA